MISYQLNLLIHPYKDLNNRNFSEVGIYDNVLEDLPTSHTFTWNEYHKTISAEVLDKIFGIEIERARETQRENSEEVHYPIHSLSIVDTGWIDTISSRGSMAQHITFDQGQDTWAAMFPVLNIDISIVLMNIITCQEPTTRM